jgi:hypothetical protein
MIRLLGYPLILLGLLTTVASGEDLRANQIEAAFLYNFSKFVDWPSQDSARPDSSIGIGVMGDDAFRTELEKVVKNHTLNGRPFEVRAVKTTEEAIAVQILFVGSGSEDRWAKMIPALDSANVLTVGKSESFASHRGIITFRLENDRVRFSINPEAGERAGLKISAQLLKLATILRVSP